MAILRGVLLLALAACYEPVLSDCTVTCTSDLDCAAGQTCTDQRCTHEGVACIGDPGGRDASVSEDSGPGDGPTTTPDGPTQGGILRVKIGGEGVVHVPGQSSCDGLTLPGDECMYTIVLGIPLTLEAEPHDENRFDKWEQACQGQAGTTCTITANGWETKVEAKFRDDD